MPTAAKLAAQVMQRIETLAQITDEPGRLTRTYGSPAMRQANELVAAWMRESGMTTETDAIGNLIGHYPGASPDAKTFLLGSHLDTVRDAGKFDGALGVLIALACVQRLHCEGRHLPFHLDVVGFADEEGVRFHSTYLGSRVLAGTFDYDDLKREESPGFSRDIPAHLNLREAILRFGGDPDALYGARRTPEELIGYAEVHIEQGPILDHRNQPVAIVTGIAGQTRIQARFLGRAAHAGTTPMIPRRDALAAAAEFVLGAERLGRNMADLVVTVGQLSVEPGASNVIPGRVSCSVDVRHQDDAIRGEAGDKLESLAGSIAVKRSVGIGWEIVQSTPAVPCSPRLTALLKCSAARHVPDPPELLSGAGHDAAALAAITPVAMLFVRCKNGLSHHPDESVREDDVAVAIAVMSDFLESLPPGA